MEKPPRRRRVEPSSEIEMGSPGADGGGGKRVADAVKRALRHRDGIYEFRELLSTTPREQLDGPAVLNQICTAEGVTDAKKNVFVRSLCSCCEKLLASPDVYTKLLPLHRAATHGEPALLQALLDNGADVTVLSDVGETPAHSAVRGVVDGRCSSEAALRCLQLLTDYRCDLNVRDGTSLSLTAVHIAVKNKLWDLVDFFLLERVNVDVEAKDETTARKLIEKHNPLRLEGYEGSTETEDAARDDLVDCLDSLSTSNEEKEQYFREFLENNQEPEKLLRVNDRCKKGRTLLELAVLNDLPGVAKELVDRFDADPNQALEVAIQEGGEIFKVIAGSKKLKLSGRLLNRTTKRTALHVAVCAKKPSLDIVEIILQKISNQPQFPKWLNARDYRGMTALHYAAKRCLKDIQALLLKHNANLFVKDNLDVPAFFDIRPESIMAHLDSQVRLTHGESLVSTAYGLEMNYNFLECPLNTETKERVVQFSKAAAEIEPLAKKDQQQSGYKAVQVEAEEVIFSEDDTTLFQTEMEPLKLMASSPEHKHLLRHPVIRSFLHLKWRRLYWVYSINFLFFLLYFITFSAYMFCSLDLHHKDNNTTAESSNSTEDDDEIQAQWKDENPVLWGLTLMFTLLLGLRELIQILTLRFKYLRGLHENLLELVIVVLVLALLFFPPEGYFLQILLATVYLLMSSDFVLLLGRHPGLAVYVTMFITVSLNFIKFLAWYLCLIYAFGVSFYILFFDPEDKFFNSKLTSIFKTIVMVSGEYETGEINFGRVSVASHIAFAAFLFFISIVMVNLLNGLAVSDTQQIRNKAEEQFCVTQAKFFYELEVTLLEMWGPLAKNLGPRVLLLRNLLPENQVTVLLNKRNQTVPLINHFGAPNNFLRGSDTTWLPEPIHRFFDTYNDIVKEALRIAYESGQSSPEEDKWAAVLERLQRIEALLTPVAP